DRGDLRGVEGRIPGGEARRGVRVGQVVHLLPVAVVDVERGRGEGEVPHTDPQDGGDDLLQHRPLEGVDAGPAPDEVVAPNEDVHVELTETGLERDEVVAGDVLPRLRVDVRVVDLDHGA